MVDHDPQMFAYFIARIAARLQTDSGTLTQAIQGNDTLVSLLGLAGGLFCPAFHVFNGTDCECVQCRWQYQAEDFHTGFGILTASVVLCTVLLIVVKYSRPAKF
jgi:hypothetical protein